MAKVGVDRAWELIPFLKFKFDKNYKFKKESADLTCIIGKITNSCIYHEANICRFAQFDSIQLPWTP